MRRFILTVAVIAGACASGHAQGNKPDVILGFDFEKTTKPWQTFDPEARIGLAADPEHVREGTSSLEFKYQQRERQPTGNNSGVLMAPIEAGLLGVSSVHFSVKALRPLPLLVSLLKQNNSIYATLVWVPAGKWVDVDLPIGAFAGGLDGPPDPDGHLSLEQVVGFTMIDGTPSLAQAGGLPFAKPTLGEQTVWLDEVRFLGDALPAEKPAHPVADGQAVVVDTCRHTFAQWVCLGGTEPTLSESPAGDNPGLRLAYVAPADTAIALYHPFPPGLAQGAKRLEISLKASFDCTIAVGFDQAGKDGKPSFLCPVELKAADGWKRFSLALSEFKPDNHEVQLDPAKLMAVALVDLTATRTHQPATNVLQVDDIVLVK